MEAESVQVKKKKLGRRDKINACLQVHMRLWFGFCLNEGKVNEIGCV